MEFKRCMDSKKTRFNFSEYDVFDGSTKARPLAPFRDFYRCETNLTRGHWKIFCKETENKARPKLCGVTVTPDHDLVVFRNINSLLLLYYFLQTCQCSYSIVLFAFTYNNMESFSGHSYHVETWHNMLWKQ